MFSFVELDLVFQY